MIANNLLFKCSHSESETEIIFTQIHTNFHECFSSQIYTNTHTHTHIIANEKFVGFLICINQGNGSDISNKT